MRQMMLLNKSAAENAPLLKVKVGLRMNLLVMSKVNYNQVWHDAEVCYVPNGCTSITDCEFSGFTNLIFPLQPSFMVGKWRYSNSGEKITFVAGGTVAHSNLSLLFLWICVPTFFNALHKGKKNEQATDLLQKFSNHISIACPEVEPVLIPVGVENYLQMLTHIFPIFI